MTYTASYYQKERGMFKMSFNTFSELAEYNTTNNMRHHNLTIEYNLTEVVSDGLIVCVEGDENLYDEDLGEFLETLPNYKLYNNIYEEWEKLKELKGQTVDLLVVQSTGLMADKIKFLMEWYLKNDLPMPKNILCVLGDEDDFLKPFITETTMVFTRPYIENDILIMDRWVGSSYTEQKR